MTATSPLVFRPSLAQRTLSALLCAGSWLVGVRGLYLLINNLPRLMAAERLASVAGEPTFLIWVWHRGLGGRVPGWPGSCCCSRRWD